MGSNWPPHAPSQFRDFNNLGLLFNGSLRNGNGSGFTREKKHALLSTESFRTTKTILFVDDEHSILSMRRLIFEALGYSALTATCGEDALEVCATHPVDAVVLDYLMSGMDGEETAHRIRKVRSDIPIILSSGCLAVPERVLEVVNAAVEKAAGPEVLIMVLAQQLHPLLDPALNRGASHGQLCAIN